VFPDCDSLDCTVDRLAEQADRKDSARVYDRLFVRHWDTWKDGRRSHLFVVPVEAGDDEAAAAPVAVMAGMDADAPSRPFGGMEEVAWTPDGNGLVFTARDVGPSEAWSTDFDLYHVPADGSAPPRCLTAANEAWDTAPSFSPDGTTLAYVAMERPGFEADRFRVVLRPWPDGEARVLTDGWDRSVGGVTWAPDGRTLYAAVQDVGEVKLFAIDVATGTPTLLVDGGHVRAPQPAGDRLLFGRDDFRSPVALFTTARDGSGLRKIVDLNAGHLEGVAMGAYERFSFPGWNDETVHGWLVRPANFDPERTYPVAFLIHGGPQGSFDNDFHYRWNPQTYAGAGYAAVMIDFHGSTGYGQAFTDSISGDWGGKPLVDLKAGLAAALERYPFLDGDRVCALGASYGGYMINWIAGRWPDRFRCLVNHDGVFDTRAMYFETEELWFPEWENGGPPWDAAASYEVFNPVRYVDRWRAPMLVLHGALDYRVPETQGIGAFTAAQRRGVPSRFVQFPDENHWVLSPANGLLWHDEVLGWMDRWTAPVEAAVGIAGPEGADGDGVRNRP
jgi:dipeptidyl aminopeptidase/acylaminoacyl peptidase